MLYPASDLVIDPVLIRKYDVGAPRCASYPTSDRFVEAFGAAELGHWLGRRNIGGIKLPLSVYVHLPFCRTRYHGACSPLIARDARDTGRSAQYINYLEQELALLAPLLGSERLVCELHWGGGTPGFLSRPDMSRLMAALERRFELAPGCERAVELDARQAEPGTIAFLAGLGFNRLSLAVQDLDGEPQRPAQRAQGDEAARRALEEARAAGFRSVNLDLAYGLPKQTLDGFNRALDKLIALNPDRVSLFSRGGHPGDIASPRRLREARPPAPESRLEMVSLATGRLIRAGYLYIGLEHFARPDNELALAQAQGRLRRGCGGYSTRPGADLIGLGASALSAIGPTYSQNHKRLDDYYRAIGAGRLPVARGVELTRDDLVRRAVIGALTCNFRVSIEAVELAHLIDFAHYFKAELADLRSLAGEGLVELSPEWIVVTPRGRLLVRVICMAFDRYLRQGRERDACAKVL